MARAGFDCVVIDLEHGLGSETSFIDDVRAVEAIGSFVVARIEENSRLRASRPLDHGATGIMFPRIEAAEEAAAAVSYVRYPPAGIRGVALAARSAGFGGGPDLMQANERVSCLLQIESRKGLKNVREIAATDGVDMLFVGPTDLSYSLGVPGDLEHPVYRSALQAIVAAAAESNVACGIMIRGLGSLEAHLEMGFTFFILGADGEFLLRSGRNEVNAFHSSEAVARHPGRGAHV